MGARDVKAKRITINLDKERSLLFSLNGLVELEEIYGSIDAAFSAMQKGKMKDIRTLLWAALIHEDETITQKQVGSIIHISNVTEVVSILTEAISEAMPKVNEKN